MRITNNMAIQQAIQQFAVARERMDEAQTRVTTGKSFTKASEDPTAATSVMANNGALRALEQYKRNIGAGNRRLAMEETAVDQLSSLLTRAKELAVSQATDTANAQTRQAAKAEANQLLAQAVSIANTQESGQYVFGGTKPDTAPFSVDLTGSVFSFAVTGGSGERQLEIASGQRVSTVHDGSEVFGTAAAGALKALEDLAAALDTGSTGAVASVITGIDTAINETQVKLSEIGARQNQMQIAEANITAFRQNLVSLNSDLQDVDLENAITELVGRQTAYQAAMAATSRVMNLNLTDYLR